MTLGPWCAAPNAILPYTPAIQASLRPPGSSASHGPFKNVLVSLFKGGEPTSQGLGMGCTTSSQLTIQTQSFHKHNQVGIVLLSHLLAPCLLSLLARVRRVWVRVRVRVMRTMAMRTMMDTSFIIIIMAFVFMAVASRVRGSVRVKVEWAWEGGEEGERSWVWAVWARVGLMTTALTSD